MSQDPMAELAQRLKTPGELDSEEVLELAGQLLSSSSHHIDHQQYNTVIFALIEKVMHLEEEIVRLRVEKG